MFHIEYIPAVLKMFFQLFTKKNLVNTDQSKHFLFGIEMQQKAAFVRAMT